MSGMEQNAKWALSKLRNPSRWWHLCAAVQFGAIGITTKLFIALFTKTQVHNKEILIKALDERPKGTPLLTISNHYSCIDDPALWGILRLNQVCNKNMMRWGLAAHNICFRKRSHSRMFLYGKGIPVVRGEGVYQPAVDVCIEKIKSGDWVHVFPEGKVNMEKEVLRLKWGVGRLILEAPIAPIVIPIWHIGMDEMLPNKPPYILKLGKKMTFNFGQPIDLSETIAHVKQMSLDDVQARKYVTDKLQEVLFALRDQTEQLHQK